MPDNRNTGVEHGKEGWYDGLAMEHHQYYKVLIKATKGIKKPTSVKFLPKHSEMPKNSSIDRILEAVKQLIYALVNPVPAAPFEHVGDIDVKD